MTISRSETPKTDVETFEDYYRTLEAQLKAHIRTHQKKAHN